jgi:uncharacterized protein (TIGR03790 family)
VIRPIFAALISIGAGVPLSGQTAATVLVVMNDASPDSRTIAEYYAQRRGVPSKNVCHIRSATEEFIPRGEYDRNIAEAVAGCLRTQELTETVLYIVTTSGVPLRIIGTDGMTGDTASVDSELTLLYSDMHGSAHALAGPLNNPFFAKRMESFRHPQFPIYLVTRLTGYTVKDAEALVDRAFEARNRGKFVIDLNSSAQTLGNEWLRAAAADLPKDRLVLDDSPQVLYYQKDVIGYASWGSNDANRKERMLGFRWLPGAIMTEFVSTNARTFQRPPEVWSISTWNEPERWFQGSPQTLTADYIAEGVTGASGHVAEPYLNYNPRPDYLLPAYYQGRNLAESYYLSIPALSWQNIVVGDPLCSLHFGDRLRNR